MKNELFNSCCHINRKSIKHMVTCKNHRIMKAAAIIFIITISNSVILLPFSMFTGLSLATSNAIKIPEMVYNFFVLLMFFNVVLNPLVCMTINARLRAIITKLGRSGPVYPECSLSSSVGTRTTPNGSFSLYVKTINNSLCNGLLNVKKREVSPISGSSLSAKSAQLCTSSGIHTAPNSGINTAPSSAAVYNIAPSPAVFNITPSAASIYNTTSLSAA